MDTLTGRIPIVVGVTGHRDLLPAEIPLLREEVRRRLAELRARCPHTPVTVLSPLAQGADLLCARAALEAGCSLLAALPMEPEAYLEGFDQEARREFWELLPQAQASFVVPPAEEIPENAAPGFFYRQAGIYVASHSHILLALWDGEEILYPEGGGTWETIHFMLREGWREAGREPSLFKPPQDGVVWHIKVGRQRAPQEEAAKPLSFAVRSNAPLARAPYPEAVDRAEAFNADAAAQQDRIAAHRATAFEELLPPEEADRLSPHPRLLAEVFCAADRLSLRYRDLRLRALRLLSGLGTLLVLVFLLYDELESDLMLPVYGLLLLGAFFSHRTAKKREYHRKYVEYRLLAEALRVQFYWEVGGVSAKVWTQYTWAQQGDMVWVKEAVAALEAGPPGDKIPLPGAAGLLRRCWVDRQAAYHKQSAGAKWQRLGRNGNLSRWLLILSVALFLLVFALEFWGKSVVTAVLPTNAIEGVLLMHPEQEITLRGFLKILLGIVSAGTALLGNYFSKLSLPIQARDSARMAQLYEMAALRLDEAGEDAPAAAEIFRRLGREAVVENGNWMLDTLEQAPDIVM